MKYVVGMHRSGTSLVSNILRDLGVNFGSESVLLAPQADNPEGFCEHVRVVDLHDALLRHNSKYWFDPEVNATLTDAHFERLCALKTELIGEGVEAIKDPRMSLFLQHWLQESDEVLVCLREPMSVARSLLSRNQIPIFVGCAIWLIYNWALFCNLRGHNFHTVAYSDFFQDRKKNEVELSKFSGATLNVVSEKISQRLKSGLPNVPEIECGIVGEDICRLAQHTYERLTNEGDVEALMSIDILGLQESISEFSQLIHEVERSREVASNLASIQSEFKNLLRIHSATEKQHLELAAAHETEVSRNKELYTLYKELLSEQESLRVHCHKLDAQIVAEQAANKCLVQEGKVLEGRLGEISEKAQEYRIRIDEEIEKNKSLEDVIKELHCELDYYRKVLVSENSKYNSASLEPDESVELDINCGQNINKLLEEHGASEQLYAEWSLVRAYISKLEDRLQDHRKREQKYQQDLCEFKRAFFPKLLYIIFRCYKLFTFRRGHETLLDRMFVDNDAKTRGRKQSRLNVSYNIFKFVIRNPNVALHNITYRNLKILFRKILGNKADLAHWVDGRIPQDGANRILAVEKFDLNEIVEFPRFDKIKTSIVVPVFNNIDITLSLLKSIKKHTVSSYEVIVADDCSTDGTRNLNKFVKNIKHVKNESNKGFLLNCNNAASQAKGDFLIFLNNDTNVTPGWLESLITLFDDPDIGVVGPKILFEDGRLQEAGGIIWNDASGWNYGRMQNPDLPEFNYQKDVDYVSGCCLAIRTNLWKEIGGFDERYVPAYYEDADICFEARARGFRVVYQPASCIIHLEGASHGTDTTSGIKQYQVVNKEKFFEKWKSILNFHSENGVDVFHARNRSFAKKTILFIDHYVPHYDCDAGSRAVYMYLKILVRMGFNVIFVGDNFYKHEPYTSALQSIGIEVLYGNTYAGKLDEWIKMNASHIDMAYLNRPHIAERYIDKLKELSIPVVYWGCDLHFLRLERQSAIEGDKSLLKESSNWREKELQLISKSDVAYYPSSVEVEYLREHYNIDNVHVLPLYAYSQKAEIKEYSSRRHGLLFVGGFGHPPNVDAVEWFHREIFNQIDRRHFPIYVVGSNVPERIQTLHSENFQVLGYLSDDDLQALYGKVRLAIIPLRFGAGVKGKVLEALYHGVPVVSTDIGLEGVDGIDEVAFRANTVKEFTDIINDQETYLGDYDVVSNRCVEFIDKNFSEEAVESIFERDFEVVNAGKQMEVVGAEY